MTTLLKRLKEVFTERSKQDVDACKLYPCGCCSRCGYIFYSRNNYYNRVYGIFRFRGVRNMTPIVAFFIAGLLVGLVVGFFIGWLFMCIIVALNVRSEKYG